MKHKYKYFISFYAQDNNGVSQNDICEFDFNVLEDKKSLEKAEQVLAYRWFGDDREVVIIGINELQGEE